MIVKDSMIAQDSGIAKDSTCNCKGFCNYKLGFHNCKDSTIVKDSLLAVCALYVAHEV